MRTSVRWLGAAPSTGSDCRNQVAALPLLHTGSVSRPSITIGTDVRTAVTGRCEPDRLSSAADGAVASTASAIATSDMESPLRPEVGHRAPGLDAASCGKGWKGVSRGRAPRHPGVARRRARQMLGWPHDTVRLPRRARREAGRVTARTGGRPEKRVRRPADIQAPGAAEPPAGIVTGLLAALLAAVFLVRTGSQAAGAMISADECFHAHAAEWIAAHHRLPSVMPELYSGFYYYYPPLLHILGAVWIAALGAGALPLLNVVFTASMLALLALGLPWRPPGRARVWAVLLCLASGAL